MSEFDKLMATLDQYEKELDELWASYDPNDSDFKIELTGLKMSILFYKYTIGVLQIAKDDYTDILLYKLRKGLSVFTYILSTSTVFINPKMTPAAILASLYLVLKNKKDDKLKYEPLTQEQYDILFNRIEKVEDVYVEKTDAIFDRTLLYEDKENVEKLEEPEKTKRIVCNRIMELLKDNKQLDIEDENSINIAKEIIKESINTDDNDIKRLVKSAKKEYNSLVKNVVKLERKDNRLQKMGRLFQ